MTDLPRPVEVLHDGRWFGGWLEGVQRHEDSWRGLVRYTVAPGRQYYHWRPEHELRRPLA